MAKEDIQKIPLAPLTEYGRSSDQENPNPHRREKEDLPSSCLAIAFFAFTTFCVFFLIFAIIFLKASSPKIRLTSISVAAVHYLTNSTNTTNTTTPTLNASLIAQISIKNDNFGHFSYEQSTAVLLYKSVRTGEGFVRSGRVGSRSAKKMNLTMELRSERVFSDERVAADGNLTTVMSGNLSRDLGDGVVEMRGFGVVKGKVYLLDMIRTWKVVEFNCSMNLDLRSARVLNLVCRD